jgi:virginiamycin B lyase
MVGRTLCPHGTARIPLVWVSVAVSMALVLLGVPTVSASPATVISYDVPGPSAQPHGVALADDGTVWFTKKALGQIGRLSPTTGAFDAFPLHDPDARPTAIAAAANGDVWFTMQGTDGIGRLTSWGDVVVYGLPPASTPADLAIARDGSVWFTARTGNFLGRIDPGGWMSTWDMPAPDGGPTGVAVDDGGGVWVAQQAAASLARFDPATEEFNEYPLTASSSPTGVAIAGDGMVWVTLRTADGVAQVDPATGSVTTFALADGASPTSAVEGPDGAIWFALTGSGGIGRITADGMVTQIGLGEGSDPKAVASDPAGSVWVAESGADRLSSVTMTGDPDDVPPTIELRSPAAGSWTAPGFPLHADFECADDGGSGLQGCVGTVENGVAVPTDALGARLFEVDAVDGAGNTASTSEHYLVFGSASGAALGGTHRAGGGGLDLSLGMGLTHKAVPLAAVTSTQVDCEDRTVLQDAEPTDHRWRVTPKGALELRWLTDRAWSGQCRTLTLSFSVEGWSGVPATFGPVAFA